MLYSKQWRQLTDWSSRAPLWVIIAMTPILPFVMVVAGICYLPRFCGVGIGALAIAYCLALSVGVQPNLLGLEFARAAIELYLLTSVTMFFGLMELAVKRLFTKNHDELNVNSSSDNPPNIPE